MRPQAVALDRAVYRMNVERDNERSLRGCSREHLSGYQGHQNEHGVAPERLTGCARGQEFTTEATVWLGGAAPLEGTRTS
jgi:hypothetical protein